MPPGAIYVGRPTIWGNPFSTAEAYDRWLRTGEYHDCDLRPPRRHKDELEKRRREVLRRLPELRGKDLACWCREGDSCHADTQIELANPIDRSKGS